MASEDYSVVITTTSASDDGAEKIAKALLEKELAACIQVTSIKSYFTWKDEMSIEDENLLLIKCKSSDYKEIEECIRENHSYEVPEVIQLPVNAGWTDYLDWISEVTK